MRRLGAELTIIGSVVICLPTLCARAAGAPAPMIAPHGNDQLQEITITAEKRRENLETVPVAASVVSSYELARNNVSDISDLDKLDPSVQLNGTINGRVPMGIRGVSSVSNEATVGITSGDRRAHV